jgi:preprotein translocase subunit SecF
MSTWGRLNRGETEIDFVGNRRKWFMISAVFLVFAIASLGFRQLNLGIEFVGGAEMRVSNPADADVSEVRSAMDSAGIEGAIIQMLDDGEAVRVTTGELDQAETDAASDALSEVTGSDRSQLSVQAVGPEFGSLVLRRSLTALGVFIGAVILFISWRLEFKMAMAGIAALTHDLLLTVGVYSMTGFTVTPGTVVAVLTILGYSLYDTVVVFDKVNELVESDEKSTYSDIVNRAMNLVLGRSLNTSLTSLLPVGGILFVGSFILGASTLLDFALALFVGIAAGTYSSIFVAAPLLAAWKERELQWLERADWVARRVKSGKS